MTDRILDLLKYNISVHEFLGIVVRTTGQASATTTNSK